MARVLYEQRSTLLALKAFLENIGWTGIAFSDGYQPDTPIVTPQVSVTFPPSGFKVLQLGNGTEKLFARRILVNAYMESEQRASGIVDDIMDFMDTECIDIIDPQGNNLGYIQCPDSKKITGEVLAPLMGNPKIVRWRGVAKGEFEAFYPGS